MSASNKRPVAGSRSPARLKTDKHASRRMRMGLLGSTALVAASLAVSPAFAQVVVGGGTITYTNGTASSNAPGASDGVSIVGSNANQSTINNVSILNTTGVPTADAVRLTVTSGVSFTGTNSLRTSVSGGSGLYVQSNVNLGVDLSNSSNTFEGSYGIRALAGSGFININSTGQTQTIIGNGTALVGIDVQALLHPEVYFGTSVVSGFATGVQLTQSQTSGGYVYFTSTGGSINATGTGIRADAVNGAANVNSQTAITATTGIHATGGSANITTSGAGTINANVSGSGTGISVTSSAGSGPLAVNVGSSIGATTAGAYGVQVLASGTSTGAISITTTAAVTGTSAGIQFARAAGTPTSTVTIGADVTGGTGIEGFAGGTTSFTVQQGATVTGTSSSTTGLYGFGSAGLFTNSNAVTVSNSGTIRSTGANAGNAGIYHGSGGATTNTATGIISGRTGIFTSSGNTTNAGTITGTGSSATEAALRMGGGTVNNTGVINGGAHGILNVSNTLTLNNTGGTITGNTGVTGSSTAGAANITNSAGGVITGVVDGINLSGANTSGTLTNSATINTGGGASSAAGVNLNRTSAAGYTIANTGTITGGVHATLGAAVNVEDGITTINNNNGGQLNSLTGLAGALAIRLNSDDLATLNLNAGSTVNGGILSANSGARTVALAGSITGGYDATGGTGVDTITITGSGSIGGAVSLGLGDDVVTLSATGSIGGAVALGGGADTFNWHGGTLGGTINGGTQGDVFNSILDAGSGSLSLSNLFSFETYDHQSGTLTLTGSRDSGAVWNIAAAATLNLSGSLTNVTGSGFGITAAAGATVNVLGTGLLDNWVGLYFNGGATSTATNSGSINGQSTGIFSTSGRVNFTNNAGGTVSSMGTGQAIALASGGGTIINNGTITAATNAALSSSNSGAGVSGSSLTNTGGMSGGSAGVAMTGAGAFAVTNTGTIAGTDVGTGVGVYQNAGTVTIANNSGGSITGNGYAVNTITTGALVLTNASGATLSGGSLGAIQANTSGAATIDLQAGSVTTGDMILAGSGARTVTVAGGFSGNLDATGNSGAVNLTLNTSATGYTLLRAGSGTDSLTFNGSGSRTFSVDNLSGWETGSFTGGAWTLTGTGNQNSFTSGVTVNGAALTISNTQQLQGSTGITMTGGGSITTTASMSNTRTINLTGGGSLGVASGQTLTQSGVVSGAGALTLNGPGTLLLSGNNTYTGGTIVNSGILRLGHTSAAGTGVIRMIDPQIDFAVGGTYNNDISLEVADGQQAADPTILNKTAGGLITLAGRIYETAGVGGANQYVTFNGGDIFLTNNANSWGGVTTVNNNTVVFIQSGGVNGLSGGSIVNNGVLYYLNNTAGTVAQNISGSGGIQIGSTAPVTFAGNVTSTGAFTVLNGAAAVVAGSRSGATGTGVVVSGSGGSLGVADGGSIVGGGQLAVHMTGVGSTLNNLGSITNSGVANAIGAAVYVQATSGTITINNGSASDTGAGSTIRGWNAGIRHDLSTGGLLVVNNYGLVMGDQWNGIENSTGGLTVNNFAGGYITTGGNGNGISSNSAGAVGLTNAGTIGRDIAGAVTVNGYGVSTNGLLTLNNQAGGAIYGNLGGIQTNAAAASITNTGAIYGVNGTAISLAAGGSVVNGGAGLTAGQNTASLIDSGGASAIAVTNGAFSLQNYGRIIAAGSGVQVGTGAAYTGAVTISNAGLIQGSSADGIRLTGAATVNNLAGGTITGSVAGIRLNGAYAYALNLAAGSTVNGMIDASLSSGANTTVLGGTLNGAYSGGSGVDTFTLGATGSMTSADLGVGADSFTYQGGAFSGVINAGSGVDSFTSALGAGSASVNLTNLVDFETFAHQSGTLTLTGTRGFSGGASVTGGTLVVNGTLQTFASVASGATLSGGGTITSAVTVADGGILANTQGSTLMTGALTLSSGSLINATFSGAGGNALFAVDGALTLDGSVNVASTGAFGFGVYGLMTYTGALNDQGLLIGTTPGTAQRMAVQTSVAGQVNIVHAPNELLFWDGGNGAQHDNGAVNGGAGVWTVAGSNWTDASGLSNGAMEPQPGFAIFQAVGGTVTVDNSLGAVGVTGIQFAANGYRIEGDALTLADPGTIVRVGDGTAPGAGWTATIASALTGAGGLVKTDLGTLILAGDSDYTGGTTVNAGRLQIGDGATAGSIAGAVTLANNTSVTFSRSDNHNFSNGVSGAGSVFVNGVATLSGAITASGGVDVLASGHATVSNVNVTTGSAVTVAANGSLTVAAGGMVSSQNGIGVQGLATGVSVANSGTIFGGGGVSSSGVRLAGGSTVNNLNGGLIRSEFGEGVNGISSSVFNAAGGTISGTLRGVFLSGAGTSVDNAGTISGGTLSGVTLNDGGTLINRAGGVINTVGGHGVVSGLGFGTITNAGSIQGVTTGLLVITGAAVSNTGTIQGAVGIDGASSNLTITNAGTIRGTSDVAIRTQANLNLTNSNGGLISGVRGLQVNGVGTITNAAGATIQATTGPTIFLQGSGSGIVNAGSITGASANSAVQFSGAATLSNQAGGVISNIGGAVSFVSAGSTLTNAGAISSSNSGGTVIFGGQGSLTNQASGTITGAGSSGGASNMGVYFGGPGSSLSNAGQISSTSTGLYFALGGGSVGNTGTISGGSYGVRANADSPITVANSGSISSDGIGIGANGFLTLNNLGGGSITGTNFYGFFSSGAGSTITNAGLISGGNVGAYLNGAGNTITNTGTIRSGGGTNHSIASAVYGTAVNATVTNVGGIENTFDGGYGVRLNAGGSIINQSGGSISGLNAAGILLGGANDYALDLQQGSSVLGGIDASASSGANTVDLRGVLTGGYLGGSGADAFNLYASAGLSGVIDGGAGADAFVLTGVGDGSLAIDSVLNFESRAMNGTGVWTLTGVDGSTAGWSLLSGTLAVTGGSAINDAAGVTIAGGGSLALLDDETIASLAGSGSVDLGSSVLTLGGAQTSLFAGVISGFGDLVIGAGHGLTLTGANTYTGTTVVDGVLTLGASNVLADTSSLLIGGGGSVDLQAFSEEIDNVFIEGVLNGSGTLTAFDYGLDGATVNANLGSGVLYNLGGVSTLNGLIGADLVSVDAGTLVLGASNRLADTAIVGVGLGATLDLGAFSDTVDVAILQGTLAGTGTLTGSVYGLADATVNANLGTGLLFNIDGISTLNGTSAANLVAVLDGTLVLGAANRIVDTADLQVLPDATFDLGAFDETVNVTEIYGTLTGTGTLTAVQHQLDGATIDANLAGGSVYVVGGDTTLNGVSSADLLSVLSGSLTLGASDRIADATILGVSSGATLDIGAFDDTVAVAALAGTLAGTGTLTAGEYDLDGAVVNANLGAGDLFNTGGVSILNGTSGSANVWVQAGTLTLGGSDRLADFATVSVASGSTLDLGAFSDTVDVALLNGTLAGTGTLTATQYQLNAATVNANLGAGALFNTGGVSTLNGTSGAASVAVQAGTLALGASNRLADNANVLVAAGSILNLNAFNDTVGLAVINGTLAGTGTLTATQYQLNAATVNANLGAGTLFNLGGVSTLNGTAAASTVQINAGTLRLGASERLSDAATVSVASGATFNLNGFNERIGALYGTGNVAVGAGRLTFGGVESAFGGRLSGTGSVVHTGGLFTLLGDHTIASISNTGGELRFVGTTTGNLSASGGSVTGAGTIGGALTASNGAVLSPGLAGVQNGIGGFTAGGLTLNGATLAIDVLGASGGNLIDQLRINGAATLTGGILAPTFHGTAATDFATRYLFLQANNLVGTFANGAAFTAAAQEGLFWRVRYDLAPNAAVLELRKLISLDPGATGTGNQRAVGQALSGGQLGASDDWAAVIGLIAGLGAADRAAALDSVSGEPLADVTTSMFSANDSFLNAMREGGMGGRNDGGEALNFVDRLSFVGGRENSADRLGDVLGAFDPAASAERGAGGWVSAYAGDQTLDGKPGQATVESKLNGFAGGYGSRIGAMSIGAAGGVTRLEGDVAARQGHYESDLSHAAGYVAYDDGVWAADVTASFYGGDLDTRRGITVGAFKGTAVGNTHVEGQALSASVARRFQVSDNTMIALGAIGTASNASVDGYTETGAGGLSLQAFGQERDWQTLQLSARGTQDYRVNGHGFRIYGGAGVMAMAGDRQATGDMRFTGAPIGFGTFVVEGAETPPLAGLADFGVEIGAGEGVTVSAGYRGLFSERLQDNQVGIKLNVSW